MGVSPSQCSTVDGTDIRVVTGTQTYKTFGELASVAANAIYCPATVTLTDPANFRIIGEDIPRVDIPLSKNQRKGDLRPRRAPARHALRRSETLSNPRRNISQHTDDNGRRAICIPAES